MTVVPPFKLRLRPNARGRRTVVGVLGSGVQSHDAASELGRWLARSGCDLLTGGGGGTMAAVSQAFFEVAGRRGLVIGIIPGSVPTLPQLEARSDKLEIPTSVAVPSEYPNPWVELAIFTHLPDSGELGTRRSSRNHVNVLSSDVLVALPGGAGTESEMWLAVRYGVPIVAFGEHGALPAGVRVARDLDEVKAFVLDTLANLPSRQV